MAEGPHRVGLAHPSITPYGGFKSKDGVTIVISVQNDREWRSFAEHVLERQDLVNDPDFLDNPTRLSRRSEVDGMVAEFFATRSRKELEALLKSARIAYGVVNEMVDFAKHPELRRVAVDSETGVISMPAHPDSQRDLEANNPRLPPNWRT